MRNGRNSMRRHFNNLVYILFLVFGIITLLVTTNTNVYAQECFGTNDCSACGGDLICVPTKSLCCQIDPPNPLCPNGGCPHDCIEVQSIKCLVPGSECQCGVDNQGRCKSCGGDRIRVVITIVQEEPLWIIPNH